MILILQSNLESLKFYALEFQDSYTIRVEMLEQILWLFQARPIEPRPGPFIGPRKEMVTPWSTNAVEILKNTGIVGIKRVEEFSLPSNSSWHLDHMLQEIYPELNHQVFVLHIVPALIRYIENIAAYNQEAGLALSEQEIRYVNAYAQKIGRPLSDAELFGFAQTNSEHCRHKIFKGRFIISGQPQAFSLFDRISQTTLKSRSNIVSAYVDNLAFFKARE